MGCRLQVEGCVVDHNRFVRPRDMDHRQADGTPITYRTYATDRAETDPCQRGTDGCSIDHTHDDGSCETW